MKPMGIPDGQTNLCSTWNCNKVLHSAVLPVQPTGQGLVASITSPAIQMTGQGSFPASQSSNTNDTCKGLPISNQPNFT